MAKYTRFINDDQWKMLKTLLPKPKRSPKGGRPPAEVGHEHWRRFGSHFGNDDA